MNSPQIFPIADRYPDMQRSSVPTEAVTSAAYFEAEREAVFKQSWFIVGREEDIAEPGDYFVKKLPTFDTTIVVTRDKEGKINAMHDVCPHRGMRVCGKDHSGNRKNFTCEFHGWVFGLDGKVVDVPFKEAFFNTELDELRMPAISVDTWEGFIFIHWQPEPAETLQEFLGELYEGYEGFFSGEFFHKAGGYSAELDINYKFYMDSSVELIHAGYTHIQNNTGQSAKSGTSLFMPPEDARLYKRHRIATVPIGLGDRELAPMEKLAMRFGGATTPYDDRVRARQHPPAVNHKNDPMWAFDILELYPSQLLFLSGAMTVHIVLWPSAHNRATLEVTAYLMKPTNAAERVALEYGLLSLRDVMREDLNMAEGCTDGLASGALKEIQLSDQEACVRHSYEVIDRAVNEYLAKQASNTEGV